jgi:hypothetical protein
VDEKEGTWKSGEKRRRGEGGIVDTEKRACVTAEVKRTIGWQDFLTL